MKRLLPAILLALALAAAGCAEEGHNDEYLANKSVRCFDVQLDQPLYSLFLDAEEWWNAHHDNADFSFAADCWNKVYLGRISAPNVAMTFHHGGTGGWSDIRFSDLYQGIPGMVIWSGCPLTDIIFRHDDGSVTFHTQLDFYTYARHELGHVLGLQHTIDPAGIMAAPPTRLSDDPPCF